MPQFDLALPELEAYRSRTEPPPDLDTFWSTTLDESRQAAEPVQVAWVDTGLALVETFDVIFSGFGGDPVHAWYHRPAGIDGDLPVVVRYQGYGNGRGLGHQVGIWPLAGYACLEMDTRGQGSAGAAGHTPDPGGSGPAHPGYLTRGITDPATYYYRRVFTDAVRAVEVARELPGVDPARVAVAGRSQGGGLALAAAALADVDAVLPDVPFLSDYRRAVEITAAAPYSELTTYLAVHRDQTYRVFATLAYFDVSVLARSATAPALFAVALMDEICPPSTVYAAYNAYTGPKELRVYPYNDHESGEAFLEVEALAWLRARFGSPEVPPT